MSLLRRLITLGFGNAIELKWVVKKMICVGILAQNQNVIVKNNHISFVYQYVDMH